MEATGDEGLLKTIRPPRLKDVGLEDCALSPEAIEEHSSRSPAPSALGDLGPSDGKLPDAFVGISSTPTAAQPRPFGNEKGSGLPQTFGDDVVVADLGDLLSDEEGHHSDIKVLGTEISEGEKACVDDLQGLKVKEEVYQKDDDQQGNVER
ncbi:uncharacterized protein LOC122077540 [Macadamia integrifolia]|uniref:uncharacterized protein LOC122077540 n=1 Tax=Macadamia integrifolia TaxID=60698 RepID=UPI001C4F9E98|nr:uncharacterized protein LOC122077540 [Macadamia integrifolia]